MARITKVTLDDASIIRRTPEVEHERRVAMADLVEENQFVLTAIQGPYELFLSAKENRLLFRFTTHPPVPNAHDVVLPLASFRRIIKDYFMICESYFDAIKHATSDKIQTIDMARRGVHNEGSELLQSLLKESADMDFDTARRLFTLICVLHIK
jgi:uncharacterized protein (UPF0262 family)